MATWDFFREIDNLRREIDESFRGLGGSRPAYPFLSAPSGRFPLVNIAEDAQNVYVQAVAPGVDPQGIEMTVLRNTLTLSGEKKSGDTGEPQRVLHRNERGFGKFSRTLELPAEIDSEKATALCRNGVLSITLPKHETAKPKRVAISAG